MALTDDETTQPCRFAWGEQIDTRTIAPDAERELAAAIYQRQREQRKARHAKEEPLWPSGGR